MDCTGFPRKSTPFHLYCHQLSLMSFRQLQFEFGYQFAISHKHWEVSAVKSSEKTKINELNYG
jgi:hypothetical protein